MDCRPWHLRLKKNLLHASTKVHINYNRLTYVAILKKIKEYIKLRTFLFHVWNKVSPNTIKWSQTGLARQCRVAFLVIMKWMSKNNNNEMAFARPCFWPLAQIVNVQTYFYWAVSCFRNWAKFTTSQNFDCILAQRPWKEMNLTATMVDLNKISVNWTLI